MNRHERRAAKAQKKAPNASAAEGARKPERLPAEMALRLILAHQRLASAQEKFQALMNQIAGAAGENGKYVVKDVQIDDKTDEVFVWREPASPEPAAKPAEAAKAPPQPADPEPAPPPMENP